MWLWFIAGILILVYSILVGWYRWAWQQLPVYTIDEASSKPRTSISVLVPARNESDNILACLQSLVAQHYPPELMQVIVIDDASEDDTAAKVNSMQRKYPFIECLRLANDAGMQSHKKRAIEMGIAHAAGELIVCTDADCLMGPMWLATIVQRFEKGDVQFIASPVVYHTVPTLLSVFQTLDFMTLQGISGASVSQRFHTMCNGANIAYSKKAFEAVNGFAGIDALPTGDDMLLMHKIFQRYSNGVIWLKSPEAIVTTKACDSWRAFFNQRIRWASKAAYFDDRRMFYVLVLVYFLNATLFALLVAGFFWATLWRVALLTILIKTMVELFFLQPVAGFFGKQRWLPLFPLLQLPHIVYTVIAGWLGRFGSYEWKGRTIAKPEKLMANHGG